MTRKLTIRTKLAATLAVPLIALAAFGALQVRSAVDTAEQVKRQAGVATSAAGPAGVVNALLVERDYETLRVLGLDKQAGYLNVKSSLQVGKATDATIGTFRGLVQSLGSNVAGSYTPALKSAASALNGTGNEPSIRDEVDQLGSHVSTANAKPAARVYDEYSNLVSTLLDADQQSGARIDDAQMRTGAELLNALNRQYDLESKMVIETVLASISQDPALARQVQQLAGQQASGENDLRVRATDAYDHAITSALSAAPRVAALKKLQAAAADPLHAKVAAILALPPDLQILRTAAVSNVASIVSERSVHLTSAAQTSEYDWVAVTIGSILLAIALLWLTNRWITRPLRALAEQAVAMAGESLPVAVKQILETPLGEDVHRPDVEPVRVRAGGEVHDVEVALNKVQDSALTLALEQARLRGNVADAFVNLGRRNQNLLSRQLEFITQLENDESDPETLEHLFRLDHLATRMRRNAESLLVLAGHEPPRTWSAPVEVGDVVRGALGEVEGYRRVRLRHLDEARVDGTAAVDVSHVIAELVENALAFSPPESDVEVYGRRDDYGYVLTIVDTGIGMAAEDLERANALISSADARTFAPSRFLGHYVVAQLAARHGLSVHLAASPSGGLTAMIGMPGALVGMATTPVDVASHDEAPRPLEALPRRESAVVAQPAPMPEPVVPDSEPQPQAEPLIAQLQSLLAPPSPPDAAPAAVPVLEPEAFADPAPAAPEPQPWVAPAAPAAWAPVVAPEPGPDPEPQPAPPAWGLAASPEPQPEPEPEPPAPEPEPAPEPVVEAAPPAPEPPARPRLGVGTFADLRAVPPSASRAHAPEPEAAPIPEPVAEIAQPEPFGSSAGQIAPPNRAATFAEVSQAVDAMTGAPAPETDALPLAPAALSEDLLPQRLPKRGRRASRMSSPWARDKKATPTLSAPPQPVPPIAPVSPAGAPMPAPMETSSAPTGSNGALHFPPGGPAFAATVGATTDRPAPDAAPVSESHDATLASANTQANAEGDERFAFFAAFRAAAERAREEAGIDDRRGNQ